MRIAGLALLVAPLLGGAQDDVQVSARLSRPTAQVGETVLVTVTARALGLRTPQIEDPDFEGLELLGTSDRSTFRLSTTAGAVREFTREYALRVLHAGRIDIGPIRVLVQGTVYETDPLQLNALAESAPAPLPDLPEPAAAEEVMLRMWVEPETVFVGQQVTLTVAAFFDPSVRSRLQRQPEYRAPDVRGVWTADMGGPPRPERRVVGGREYFVQVFRRALFPLADGTIRVPPASVVYEVRRGLIYAPESFQIESGPARVTVRPLPTAGRPSDFAGAVGRFETETWLDRSELQAGEAVNLVVEVRGTGNLNSVARPELEATSGLRLYEGGEDAEVQLEGDRFAGQKRFSWVLVPERPGQHVVPGVRVPYFDPEQGAYRVADTEPVAIEVRPSAVTAGTGTTATGRAIRYVKPEPGRQPLHPERRAAFWGLLVLALAIAVGSVAWRRYVVVGRRARRAAGLRRPRRHALRELRPAAETGDAVFFMELRAAFLRWIEDRLGARGLSLRGMMEIQHTLEDAGVPPHVALEVVELLEQCSRYRYAPEPPGPSERNQLLDRAEALLAQVDREAVAERRVRSGLGRRTTALALAVGLGVGLTAWPGADASAQDTRSGTAPERAFEDGVSAYGAADYGRAARLFRTVLESRPEDPHALYNLGNALYELGDRGRAVALWVRALRLRPRDDDARFNLRVAVGDDPVIGSTLAPVPVSRDELAILLMVFWIAGCACVAIGVIRNRKLITATGTGGLAVAVAAALLLLLPRSDHAVVVEPGAGLRAGPVARSEVLATPAPGTGYRVLEHRGHWLRVSRGGTAEGWIESDDVELVRQSGYRR